MLKGTRPFGPIIFFLFIISPYFTFSDLLAKGQSNFDLRVLTLNLHGPHPMNQGERYIEYPAGKLSKGWSHPFYFSPLELKAGQKIRDHQLASTLRSLQLDLIFLQEVTAGNLQGDPSCQWFQDPHIPLPNPTFHLLETLKEFRAINACRGNRGWWTNADTFKNQRIYKANSLSEKFLVFNYNDNPYPQGLVIEGLSILMGPQIELIKFGDFHLPINYLGEKFFFQWALIKKKSLEDQTKNGDSPPVLVINLHQGHKISNFEQSLALRIWLSQKDRVAFDLNLPVSFQATILAGDFNEEERPEYKLKNTEPTIRNLGLIPLEKAVQDDFRIFSPKEKPENLENLRNLLTQWNQTSEKSWANIQDPHELQRRIDYILESWKILNPQIQDGFGLAFSQKKSSPQSCVDLPGYNGTCKRNHVIDHIFHTSSLEVKSTSILFNHHNWTDVQNTFSDHPAIFTHFKF